MITTTSDSPFDYAYSEASALTLDTLVPGVDYTLVRNNDNSDHGIVECFFAMQDDAARYISRLEAAFRAGELGEHFHPQTATLDLRVFTVRRSSGSATRDIARADDGVRSLNFPYGPGGGMTATKFRKKPTLIEAMPLDGHTVQLAQWLTANGCSFRAETHPTDATQDVVFIRTPESEMRADPGDYVIRGVQGEFYPCKPDIFEATYEPA